MVNLFIKSRPDGSKYEGQWLNGKQHGKGLYISRNGEMKEGLWENGKKIKWNTENTNS